MPNALRWILATLAVLAVLGALGVVWIWNDRPDVEATGLPLAAAAKARGATDASVRLTWLGVTTLLFDDGETRILTDGFFSRPGPLSVLGDRPVAPDLDGIETALGDAGIGQLAAVIPVHSHYDHAMDTAEVAKRTGALVVGSSSTLNLARGAGLSEERLVDFTSGGSMAFGHFTITLVRSRHMPIDDAGNPPFPGSIDAPLVPPAPVSAWREGASYSIFVAHPRGTALVQGSAGYVEGALAKHAADVVLLGIGGLGRLGEDYARSYWNEIVAASGARRVFPIHWDDFTLPYGEVRAFPRILGDLLGSLVWLSARAAEAGVSIERLPFGRAVVLY